MKKIIGFPASGPELTDAVSGHFGHCQYFVGVELDEEGSINKAFSLQNNGHSSCLEPVMNMQSQKVTDMIVGGIGGRPYMGFLQVGINLYQAQEGTIQENIEKFKKGELKALGGPSCSGGTPQHQH